MSRLKATLAAGVTAVALASGAIATSSPAAAWGRGGGFAGPFVGGLAVGALLGAAARPADGYGGYGYGYGYAPAYGYDPVPVYSPCYRSQSPVYDVYGNFAGMRTLRVCN